jgi:hypothetical protein
VIDSLKILLKNTSSVRPANYDQLPTTASQEQMAQVQAENAKHDQALLDRKSAFQSLKEAVSNLNDDGNKADRLESYFQAVCAPRQMHPEYADLPGCVTEKDEYTVLFNAHPSATLDDKTVTKRTNNLRRALTEAANDHQQKLNF